MPWYKFHANHGGGHQSHTEEYFFFETPLRKADRKAEWENWIYDRRFGGDSSIGDVKLVRKLPEKVREAKLQTAVFKLASAQKMIKQLGGTSEVEVHTTTVTEKVWDPGDTYFVIETQVFSDKFEKGDEVEVIVRKTGVNHYKEAIARREKK